MNVRGIRRFFRRRGADLVVAGLIVGWVVACAKKKASAPPAAPAPAALAEASPAPAAPLPDPTAATIAGLEVVAARGECIDYPDFTTKMRHARDLEWSELKSSIRAGAVSPEVTTEWLVLAHHYQSVCDSNYEPEEINARELLADFTPIPERLIDRALKERRCGFLGALDELEMWPYEVQFADEVQERDFAGAEVTRVLWRDTLSNYVEACGEAISRRQRVGTRARIAKLDRIIGLDDQVLIELRSKMLTSLENGDSQQILAYSRAISEREKVLDSRHAAEYEEKLRDIEAAVVQQGRELAVARTQAAAAAASAATASAASTPAQRTDKTADLAQKTANVAQAAKNVHDTVKTARSIGKMFGL